MTDGIDRTTVTVDVFDKIWHAAKDAGIDPESMELDIVEFTEQADLTVEIREKEPDTCRSDGGNG